MYPEDIAEVLKIERASFSTPWSEISFNSELRSQYSITKVAEMDGITIGYTCVRQIDDECHLLNLTVHPDYRNQGIAELLLKNIFSELNMSRCGYLYLEVRASNLAARRLYEHAGFRNIGIRKNYYVAPGEDAVVMMLELP